MTAAAVEHKKLFIANEWRDAASGSTMDVVNPATEDVIATVAAADRRDVDAAVDAARAALRPAATVPAAAKNRRRSLFQAASGPAAPQPR